MTYPATANSLQTLTEQLRAAGCVFAEEEAALLLDAAADLDRVGDRGALADLMSRRIAGEPLEHVIGRVDFAGLPIRVGPGVFVPRRRSELLVTSAFDLLMTGTSGRVQESALTRLHRPLVLVELCCGVAAIATALTRALLDAGRSPLEVHATDADLVAVCWAGLNLDDVTRDDPASDVLERPAVRQYIHRGDLYDALPDRLRGSVDLLLAVPPYVPTSHLALMPTEARLHEPRSALDGGPDGLEVTRRIVVQAPDWLAPGGALLVETSPSQQDVLAASVGEAGLAASVITRDEPEAVVVIGVNPC
jgi:release factor glutamine methyltransferase